MPNNRMSKILEFAARPDFQALPPDEQDLQLDALIRQLHSSTSAKAESPPHS
jgi:hypothetical protein